MGFVYNWDTFPRLFRGCQFMQPRWLLNVSHHHFETLSNPHQSDVNGFVAMAPSSLVTDAFYRYTDIVFEWHKLLPQQAVSDHDHAAGPTSAPLLELVAVRVMGSPGSLLPRTLRARC
jgi:hypothetical protein